MKTNYSKRGKLNISVQDLCLTGIMVAIIEVCKLALNFLPNIELTTFWLILFTIVFGRKSVFTVPVFILIEGCMYGFGNWWIMYLYTWPLLVCVTYLFRKQESVLLWSILSSIFGFLFGLFCSVPYFVMGVWEGGLRAGLHAGFTWWVAGIPFDLIHGVSNFVIMLVLYRPIISIMKKAEISVRKQEK